MPYFITDSAPECDGWATVKDDGDIIGCHTTKQDAIDQMVAVSIAEGLEPGGELRADAPAPPEDQIEGSEENEPGSAATGGGGIELSEATRTALANKARDHNQRMEDEGRPSWTPTSSRTLAAVYRRGAGAYSTSHRPGISRGQWAMARVNAFLYLLSAGRPENSAYVGDNDLLPADHPKSTRSVRVLPENYRPALSPDVPDGRACGNCRFYDEGRVHPDGQRAWCERWDDYVRGDHYCNAWQAALDDRQVEIRVPEYVRDAAAEGLDWYRQGLAGDGVVPRTVLEARGMARGQMTEDKVVRANAWAARHEGDLEPARNNDRRDPGFPGPGAVAHALWGINPSNPEPARAWLARTSEQIADAEDERTSDLVIEKRTSSQTGFEVRAENDGMTFTGSAAVFDVDSEPLPFIERIDRGAFTRTLKRNNIRLFVNHDPGNVLATVRSKTLMLEEDDIGLRVTAQLPNTSLGRDMAELIRTRVVDSMSFGFTVPRGGDRWDESGMRRNLKEVRLHEVSIVTGFPAYTQTTATVRTLEQLAEKAGADADDIAVALTELEGGQPSPEAVELLNRILSSLRPDPVEPEPPTPSTPVSLLMKQLEHLNRA